MIVLGGGEYLHRGPIIINNLLQQTNREREMEMEDGGRALVGARGILPEKK